MSASLQLIVKDESLLQAIRFNYEDLKTALDERLENYRQLVVSEDGITAAKADRALLNKLEDALKTKQQEIERKLLGDFVTKIKELRSMIAGASSAIDEQIKRFEEAAKDEKRKEIKRIFDRNASDLSGIVPLESIWNKKWENKTVSLKTIESEIVKTLSEINNSLAVINELKVDQSIVVAVKDYYLRTLDMTAALAEKTRLEKRAAELAEREKQAAERAAERAAALAVQAVKPASMSGQNTPDTAAETAPSAAEAEPVSAAEPALTIIDFRVWVTLEQRRMLGAFLKENNIKYGRVPENN